MVDCGGVEDGSTMDDAQEKKRMIKENDRIGDAPEISSSSPAYRDRLHGAMIAAAC